MVDLVNRRHVRNRPIVRATIAALVGVAFVALSSSVLAAGSSVKITEKSEKYHFSPQSQSVAVGGTVTWTNTSDAAHTVTSDTGAFSSPTIKKSGGTFSFTFKTAGTFKYHCTIHPYMTGSIVVGASAPSVPNTSADVGGSSGSPSGVPWIAIGLAFGAVVVVMNRLLAWRRWGERR